MRNGESDGRGREEYTNRLHWGLGNKRLSSAWQTKKIRWRAALTKDFEKRTRRAV